MGSGGGSSLFPPDSGPALSLRGATTVVCWPEQMFMALDKFRAAVLVVAAGFHNDFAAIAQAANRAKTRVVVLADTGESAQRHMGMAPMAWSTAT